MNENNFNDDGWTVVGKKNHHRKKNQSTFHNFNNTQVTQQHGDHQDWTNTTIGRKTNKTYTTNTSFRTHEDKIATDEDYSVRKFKFEFINAVKQKRNELNWNQEKLAQELRFKTDIIKNFESGKSPYNPNLVSSLRRVLKIGKEVKA